MIPVNVAPSGATGEKAKALVYLMIGVLVIVVVIILVKKIFGGWDSLLEMLHLKDDKQTAANKAAIQSAIDGSASTQSAFTPTMHESAPGGTVLPNSAKAKDIAAQIWGSVGAMWDDPEQGLAAFKQLKNQASVSWIADVFNQQYQRDLLDWLKQKYDTRTQLETLTQIINFVNNLPKYSTQ